jgi:hypothetical protein
MSHYRPAAFINLALSCLIRWILQIPIHHLAHPISDDEGSTPPVKAIDGGTF